MELTHDWDDKGFPAGTKPGERFMRTMDPQGRAIRPQEEEALSLEEAAALYRTIGLTQVFGCTLGDLRPNAALPKSLALDLLAESRQMAADKKARSAAT